MSLAEIKDEVGRLSSEERQMLVSYICELGQREGDPYYDDMDRRMKAMDSGRVVTQTDLEQKHEHLVHRGK